MTRTILTRQIPGLVIGTEPKEGITRAIVRPQPTKLQTWKTWKAATRKTLHNLFRPQRCIIVRSLSPPTRLRVPVFQNGDNQ